VPIYYILNSLERRVNRFWWYRRLNREISHKFSSTIPSSCEFKVSWFTYEILLAYIFNIIHRVFCIFEAMLWHIIFRFLSKYTPANELSSRFIFNRIKLVYVCACENITQMLLWNEYYITHMYPESWDFLRNKNMSQNGNSIEKVIPFLSFRGTNVFSWHLMDGIRFPEVLSGYFGVRSLSRKYFYLVLKDCKCHSANGALGRRVNFLIIKSHLIFGLSTSFHTLFRVTLRKSESKYVIVSYETTRGMK